ncbi:hypothetical protein AVEN_253103-1, partial [Araneus ventricosus]
YVNCDEDITTSKSFTIDESTEDKLPDANLRDDEDVIPPFFKDAMDSIEKLRSYYFCQKSNEKTFNELNSIHSDVHTQSDNQHIRRCDG